MKGLLAIGVCLFAALPALAQNPAPGLPGASLHSLGQLSPTNVHPAVARIVAPGNGSISYGSGTLVFANEQVGLVITNWHVINEATGPISVHFPDGFYSIGTVERVDRDWDLAAIAIRKPNARPVRLAAAPARPGEMLTIAGYGSGNYRAASGPCTQYVAPGATFPFEMVEVAVRARQGDSGGPILNSRGELAGVLFGEGQGRTSGSYCGRVRWFLSNIVPAAEFDASNVAAGVLKPVPPRPTVSEAMPEEPRIAIAQTPVVQTGHGGDAARAAAPIAVAVAMPTPAAPGPQVVVASTRSSDPAVEETRYLGWEDVAGHTMGDQVKTVLAVIGVLAIILHALSWLSRERPVA